MDIRKSKMGWDTINPVCITGGRSELIFGLARACSPEGNGGLLLMKPPNAGKQTRRAPMPRRHEAPCTVPALEHQHMSKSKILSCRPHRHMKGTFAYHQVRLDVTHRLRTEGADSSGLQWPHL